MTRLFTLSRRAAASAAILLAAHGAYSADYGIPHLEAEEEAPVWFDLYGRPVDNPSSGIYIMIRAGKSQKIIIR